MKTYNVTVPEIAIVAATRGMAGAGAGLLLSPWMGTARDRCADDDPDRHGALRQAGAAGAGGLSEYAGRSSRQA